MKTRDRLLRRYADRLDFKATELTGQPIWNEPGDGWWAWLKPGWKCAANDSNSCHERTLRELEAALKAAKRPVHIKGVLVGHMDDEEVSETVDAICSGKY